MDSCGQAGTCAGCQPEACPAAGAPAVLRVCVSEDTNRPTCGHTPGLPTACSWVPPEGRRQGARNTGDKKDTGAEEKQGGPERRLGDRESLARTLRVATDNTYPDNLARTITL